MGTWRESISRADWEQREVYAHFGLAIYLCQVLETGLVNYVALLKRLRDGRPMEEPELDELFSSLFGRTLGGNLKELRILQGDPELAESLSEALKLRNDLVHHWMRDRALDQGTSQNREALVLELIEAQGKIQKVSDDLSRLLLEKLDSNGIPQRWIEEEAERLRQLAECREVAEDETGSESVVKPE